MSVPMDDVTVDLGKIKDLAGYQAAWAVDRLATENRWMRNRLNNERAMRVKWEGKFHQVRRENNMLRRWNSKQERADD